MYCLSKAKLCTWFLKNYFENLIIFHQTSASFIYNENSFIDELFLKSDESNRLLFVLDSMLRTKGWWNKFKKHFLGTRGCKWRQNECWCSCWSLYDVDCWNCFCLSHCHLWIHLEEKKTGCGWECKIFPINICVLSKYSICRHQSG